MAQSRRQNPPHAAKPPTPLWRRPQAVAAKAKKMVGPTQPRAPARGYPQTAPSARIATHTNNNDSIFRSAKLISPQTRSQSHRRMNLHISEANCQMLKLLDPQRQSRPIPLSKSQTNTPPQKRSDGEGPGERPQKWRQAANKIPPRSKAANPRFAADPNSRRQSETNGRYHPTSGFRPRSRFSETAPSARKQTQTT